MLIRWVNKGPLNDSSIKEWTNSILVCRPKTSPDSYQVVETRHDLWSPDPRGCRAQPHPQTLPHLGVLPRDLNDAVTSRGLRLIFLPPWVLFFMTFTKSYKHTWVRTGRRQKETEGTGAGASCCAVILWPLNIFSFFFFLWPLKGGWMITLLARLLKPPVCWPLSC